MTLVSCCILTRFAQWRLWTAQPNTHLCVRWLLWVTSTVKSHWTCRTLTGLTSSQPLSTPTGGIVWFYHRYVSMHLIWSVCPCVLFLWMYNKMTQIWCTCQQPRLQPQRVIHHNICSGSIYCSMYIHSNNWCLWPFNYDDIFHSVCCG